MQPACRHLPRPASEDTEGTLGLVRQLVDSVEEGEQVLVQWTQHTWGMLLVSDMASPGTLSGG
jgi:hypothetical protein